LPYINRAKIYTGFK